MMIIIIIIIIMVGVAANSNMAGVRQHGEG